MLGWLGEHWFQVSVVALLALIAFQAVGTTWNTTLAVKRLDLANQLLNEIARRLSN
jgi:hypothetical protein